MSDTIEQYSIKLMSVLVILFVIPIILNSLITFSIQYSEFIILIGVLGMLILFGLLKNLGIIGSKK